MLHGQGAELLGQAMHDEGGPPGGADFSSQGMDLVMSGTTDGGRGFSDQQGGQQDSQHGSKVWCQVGGSYIMDHVPGRDFWF